jgi:hypothetical protein
MNNGNRAFAGRLRFGLGWLAFGVAGMVLAGPIFAGERPAKHTSTRAEAKANRAKKPAPKAEGIQITGSHLSQKAPAKGMIVNTGPSPLCVIDRDAIRRSGAATAAGVLSAYGHR